MVNSKDFTMAFKKTGVRLEPIQPITRDAYAGYAVLYRNLNNMYANFN